MFCKWLKAAQGDWRPRNGAGDPRRFVAARLLLHLYGPDGEIWVNGIKLPVTTSGSGGAIAYSTSPARIGSQGGLCGISTGFNGRIYMVALYRCSFTPREVQLRAGDPYQVIRRPLATARAAQSSVPPPVGDSGKGRDRHRHHLLITRGRPGAQRVQRLPVRCRLLGSRTVTAR